MLTMLAAGMPNMNKITLDRFDRRVKYPKTALRVKRDIIDLRPLHACTTSRV
jgi:hypothetical protein